MSTNDKEKIPPIKIHYHHTETPNSEAFVHHAKQYHKSSLEPSDEPIEAPGDDIGYRILVDMDADRETVDKQLKLGFLSSILFNETRALYEPYDDTEEYRTDTEIIESINTLTEQIRAIILEDIKKQ